MSTSRHLTVLGLVLFSACGGTADPQAYGNTTPGTGGNLPTSAVARTEQAGSRLRKVWNAANDNSVTQAGWYDTQLKTRCTFERVAGNVELCVPDNVYTLTHKQWADSDSLSSQRLHTDAACSNSDVAMVADTACAKYGVVRVLPDPTSALIEVCGGGTDIEWYLATPLNPATQVYEFGVPAGGGTCCSCNPSTIKVSSGVALMKMEKLTASNADRSSLVRAELSVDP